jgi:hypothetical protein
VDKFKPAWYFKRADRETDHEVQNEQHMPDICETPLDTGQGGVIITYSLCDRSLVLHYEHHEQRVDSEAQKLEKIV